MHEKIIELLNNRIQQEELSARIYKAMSVWLNYNGFAGAAKLWQKYSDEEVKRSEITYNYLLDLDIMPAVDSLQKPQTAFESLEQIIQLSYKHELDITSQCNRLAKNSYEVGDFQTLQLAQSYLKEQVEEQAKTKYWIDRLKAFGNSKEALRLLDNEMGEI